MRKRDYIFLAAMIVANALIFWFEPETRTPTSSLIYGAIQVGLMVLVLKVILGRDYE